MAGIYDERILGAKQQAETARKLREGIVAPQGQMVDGIYVAPSWTQHAANLFKSYTTGKDEREALGQLKELEAKKAADVAEALRQMGPQEQSIYSDAGPQMPTRMPTEQERMAALLRGASVDPEVFQPQIQMEQWQQGMADKQTAREESAALKREQMAAQAELKREQMAQEERLTRMNIEGRRDLANAVRASKPSAGGVQWKYDAGSDTWVAPPSEQYPQGIVTASPQRAKSAENFNYLADKMVGTKEKPGPLYTTTTGGPMGLAGTIGKVTDSQAQKRFNNLREQLSTELRTIFRIPGEGALSDKEQAQYGVQLPELGNDSSVNEAIMQDLKYRINNKTTASSNPLTPQIGNVSSGNIIRYDAQGRRL